MDLSELVFFPLKMAIRIPGIRSENGEVFRGWKLKMIWMLLNGTHIYFQISTPWPFSWPFSWIYFIYFQDFHGFSMDILHVSRIFMDLVPDFFQLKKSPSPRHHSQHVFAEHPQLVTVPGQLVGGIGDHLGAIHSKSSHPADKRSMDSMDVMIFMGF